MQIRPITPDELDDFLTLSVNAYPGVDLFAADARARFASRLRQAQADGVGLIAAFEGAAMRGVMRTYDFEGTLHATQTLVGGVGGVAVDLAHKKERVAYALLQQFLRDYREKGACLLALYPFRPDFYRRMGFGYGAKVVEYRFAPASLPRDASKADVALLTPADRAALVACFERYRLRTHGMLDRAAATWDAALDDPAFFVAGVRQGDRISGYVSFRFQSGRHGHFLSNSILIREWIYETAGDLRALCAFLHTQADQVETIVYHTADPDFHILLGDPRDPDGAMLEPTLYHVSSRQGLGLMWRVIDVARLFEVLGGHDFGGQTLTLRIELADSFFPANAGATTVRFEGGRARLAPDAAPDVVMALEVGEFSALVMGAVDLATLARYGLVTLSDATAVASLTRLFAAPTPVGLTTF